MLIHCIYIYILYIVFQKKEKYKNKTNQKVLWGLMEKHVASVMI